MSYQWTRGESIDAWKLNKTGQQRQMYVVHQSGLQGGLSDASVPPCERATSSYINGPLYAVQEEEKWIGAGKLLYDFDCQRYKIAIGPSNVSGVMTMVDTCVAVCKKGYTVEPEWVEGARTPMAAYLNQIEQWQCACNTCPPPLWCWQNDAEGGYPSGYITGPKIIWSRLWTTCDGTGYCHAQYIEDASVPPCQFKIPTPASKKYGAIEQVMGNQGLYQRTNGIIRASYCCGQDEAHLELVNSDDTVVWPVPRPMGFEQEGLVDTEKFSADYRNRWAKTHWSPMISRKQTTSPIIPSYSVGEGGGVAIDRITDAGTDAFSLRVASGVEFYDCLTIAERNTNDPRPHGTSAYVPLGNAGYIRIASLGGDTPWQFMVSGGLDIGSIAVPPANYENWRHVDNIGTIRSITYHDDFNKICCGNIRVSSANWIGNRYDPGSGAPVPQVYCCRRGVVGNLAWGVQSTDAAIVDGTLVMPTATYDRWTPSRNRTGLISGIETYSCANRPPWIDCRGIIHIPYTSSYVCGPLTVIPQT